MTTSPSAKPEVSQRISALERAAVQWKRQLVDTARSPLLYYRDLKTGTLDLTPAPAGGQANSSVVDSLLAGRKVRLSNLISGTSANGADPRSDARGRLKRIGQVAQAYLEEKGASTLFVAVGLATWDVPTGARPNAPVILLPLSVEPEDAAHREFVLEVSGDAHFNPIMAHSLRTDYGVELVDDDFDLEEPPKNFSGMQKMLGGRWPAALPRSRGSRLRPGSWWATSGTTTCRWWLTWSRTWRPSPVMTWWRPSPA